MLDEWTLHLNRCHKVAHRAWLLIILRFQLVLCDHSADRIVQPGGSLATHLLIVDVVGCWIFFAIHSTCIGLTRHMLLTVHLCDGCRIWMLLIPAGRQGSVIGLVQSDIVPFHVEQLLSRGLVWIIIDATLLRTPIFIFILHTVIETAIAARPMLLTRFLSTRKTVNVSLANKDFFLPVVDLIYLVLSAFWKLADFANHDLQLQYVSFSLLIYVVQLLYLLIDFFFARESAKLPIDALDVELAAKVRNLLVPELDHVHHSFIETFCFTPDHVFKVLLRLLVDREYLSKHIIVKLCQKELLDLFSVNLWHELCINIIHMLHSLVHLLIQVF